MRMYLAGVENKTKEFTEVKPPYILFSFAACQGNGKKRAKIMNCVTSEWCKDYLCDSGAFTFRQKNKTLDSNAFDRYVDEYIEFINGYNVRHFFEMDVDNLIGLEKVEEYRKKIEKKTGKQSIPVWHSNRGWKYFERMCDEYEYVSIGGIAKNPNGKKLEKVFPWFIDHAHKTGTQIHGLGYTITKNLKKYPFDSVDSTSWSGGARYGISFEYRTDGMVGKKNIYEHKRVDGKRLEMHNLTVWAQYARMLDHQRKEGNDGRV